METIQTSSNTLARPMFKAQYENYIGGQWIAPVDGEYFENFSPVDSSLADSSCNMPLTT